MKIGIVGGGSVGLLIGSYLSELHEITIYVRREEQKRLLNEQGLILTKPSRHFSVKALLLEEMTKEETIVICVKQHHIHDVLQVINKKNERTPLVFLQNGMGHIDYAKNLQQPVYVGVVDHGALRVLDNQVIHTGHGNIRIAALHGGVHGPHLFAEQCNQPGFPVQIANDWQQLLAEKLVINAVINPLTAIFGVPNGDIMENSFLRKIAKQLCLEAVSVLELDFTVCWDRVQLVAKNTKENTSSMLKDLKESRKTEIESISGYIMNHGKTDVPYTSFVFNSIKALEEKKGLCR